MALGYSKSILYITWFEKIQHFILNQVHFKSGAIVRTNNIYLKIYCTIFILL